MAHWSEICRPLEIETCRVVDLNALHGFTQEEPGVSLVVLPPGRTDTDAARSSAEFQALAAWCGRLHAQSALCILTTPPDAARLLPFLQDILRFQLWVAVKISENEVPILEGVLSARHLALLVLTRYQKPLEHTKTRIGYTYCPACEKTTKDYGGKKHTYHEYGTLMSDVWRDIEIDPNGDLEALTKRLTDVFGLAPYHALHVLDLRCCIALQPHVAAPSPLVLPAICQPPALESQLINGDCLETLRRFPDDCVDFCFADPPYNLQKKYDRWNDALELVEYFAWCDLWLSELLRVLKPGGTLAVLNLPLWAARHAQHLTEFAYFQAWIVWEALGFPVRMVMPAHYALLCVSKGPPRSLPGLADWEPRDAEFLRPLAEGYCLRAGCVAARRRAGISDCASITDIWSDVHRLKHNSRRVNHPCQLPPLLMRRLFALFTCPGEIVLDCFNGAGTSTLVAAQMDRRFIGIELSPRYHQLASERHGQVVRGEDPFGKSACVPETKNSPVRRLTKQSYAVSKKTLQLEVRRIAQELGRLPSREEVERLGAYSIDYYNQYFSSWGEVCAAARTTGMSESRLLQSAFTFEE